MKSKQLSGDAINFAAMRIAIYTGKLPAEINEKFYRFIVEMITSLPTMYKEYELVILSDKPLKGTIQKKINCNWSYLQAPPDNSLLLKWWLEITVPAVLKKIKADLFISTCAVTTKNKIHQCLIVPGLQYIQYPGSFSKTGLFFFNHYMRGFMRKASAVIVPADMIKVFLNGKYKTDQQKIFVVPFCTELKKINETGDEKGVNVKKIAGDKPYFLVAGEQLITGELLYLLKAYSVFKKMQQSGMKLIIIGKPGKDFSVQLESYKYRNDIIIYEPVSAANEAELIAGAYALVVPAAFDSSGIYGLEAMQTNVPVICAAGTATEQFAGNAALYFNPADFTTLAAAMMQLYKDEAARAGLIKNGKKAMAGYNRKKTTALIKQAIEKAID